MMALEHFESLQKEINISLGFLSERQRNILKLYFGIGISEPLSLEDIGERYGLTRERVRQIKDKAIENIRLNKRYTLLRYYL
jgi:RNA polymerase primary sigma factor